MAETHAFFPVLLAVLPFAGVIALFSQAERTGSRTLGSFLLHALWPVALLLAGAWGLWQSPWPILAAVPVLLSSVAVGIMIRRLFNTTPQTRRRGTPVALGLIVIGGWAAMSAWQADDHRYWAIRNERERLEAELAAAHQASVEEFARMRAKRDPGRFEGGGVKEGQIGPLLAWLALQPLIEVDWEYETQRDAMRPARRQIPLAIALLNNQFESTPLAPIDLPGDFPGETEPALWLAWVSRRDGREALAYFSGAMPSGRQWLAPAERADFTVNWDGCNQRGELLPPGEYTVHLQSARLAATGESATVTVDLAIQDSGPIIQRIADPVMESLDEKVRMQQEWQRNNESWQRLQQWNWQPLLPR